MADPEMIAHIKARADAGDIDTLLAYRRLVNVEIDKLTIRRGEANPLGPHHDEGPE